MDEAHRVESEVEVDDIIERIMREMEEVIGLLQKPRRRADRAPRDPVEAGEAPRIETIVQASAASS